jgi:2,4-dienoyl-CoA reductase-like NADH-dependent reductase (Old Yellow Enzyme family)
MGSAIFSPFTIRDITFRNRIGVSPMCQYSCEDGSATDWHLVHLGSRAVGGAGLVMVEASAVTADGRISPQDMGIWKDEHIEPLARCAHFIRKQGAVPGIQLAHAGRKASTTAPWEKRGALTTAEGGWRPIWSPSAVAFDDKSPVPEALTRPQIAAIVQAFADAAKRAESAGFDFVEIHSAHGYLLHEFLSPLSNRREDEYGGSFENRTLAVRQTVEAIRKVWPERLPLFIRISATDWADGGWNLDDSVALAKMVKPLGIDLVDCSSGALIPGVRIPASPGYQVPFSQRIRTEAGIATAAVGMITEPNQANSIIEHGQADIILMAREFLRDPYWSMHAAKELGEPNAVKWPVQYERAAN